MTTQRGELAILSDVHGNLEALRSVLADIDGRGITDVVCLGDIVGYGPEPEACAVLVRERHILAVQGNHEQALHCDKHRCWFNPTAQTQLKQTEKLLSEETGRWLASLPTTLVHDGFLFVHGCPPDSMTTYVYALDEEDLARRFSTYAQPVAFVGHTHEFNLYSYDGTTTEWVTWAGEAIHLGPDKRWLVNVGSVGQPRDGDSRAKYATLNLTTMTLTARRVQYDIDKTADKIIALGFPESYAKRLY